MSKRQRDAVQVSMALLVAIGLCTCDAPAHRQGVSAQPPPRPSAPSRFDPSTVALSADAPERTIVASLDPAESLRLSEAALTAAPDPASRGRLHWLAAAAAKDGDQHDVERRHLEALAAMDHPLSPWARVWLANLMATPDEAEAVIVLLADLPNDFPDQERATALTAIALAATGRADEAVPMLRALVASAPESSGAATAGMPLAEILAGRDDVAAREEALTLYRRVATRAPGARVGEIAAERADVVLASLPAERRAALRDIAVEDRFARAQAFFNAMRHDEAEAAFVELANDSDAATACRARLMQGKTLLRRRQRDDASELLERVGASCDDLDVRIPALFLAAEAHGRRGRHEKALSLYDAVASAAPTHRLADDAVYSSAFSARAMGDEAEMRVRFTRAATEFPEGDMRGEARFRLAWDARERAERAGEERQARLEEALGILEASLDRGPLEEAVDLRGRAAYWRARTLAELGRVDDAVRGYAELARRFPLSYYAQQSLRRLSALAPAQATRLREELSTSTEHPLSFPLRDELMAPAFARAVELLRVNEPERAMRELTSLGLLGETADEEEMWLAASVLDGAGAHPEASLLARRHLRGFLDDAPVGEARHRWRIAYPRAFAPLIEDAAEAEGVPATFVRAIAREESAFDPRAVSVANAYGLIQLIRPTARRFGDELGLPSTPQALKTPEINVRIGTRFIGFLFRRYADNPAVVPSAYNAGEGASDRWLRERGDRSLDVWIEDIPYDETRRYTRRVLQTWGTYAWLDEGQLPALVETLPQR